MVLIDMALLFSDGNKPWAGQLGAHAEGYGDVSSKASTIQGFPVCKKGQHRVDPLTCNSAIIGI